MDVRYFSDSSIRAISRVTSMGMVVGLIVLGFMFYPGQLNASDIKSLPSSVAVSAQDTETLNRIGGIYQSRPRFILDSYPMSVQTEPRIDMGEADAAARKARRNEIMQRYYLRSYHKNLNPNYFWYSD